MWISEEPWKSPWIDNNRLLSTDFPTAPVTQWSLIHKIHSLYYGNVININNYLLSQAELLFSLKLVVVAVQAVGNRPSDSVVAGLWINMWAAVCHEAVHVFYPWSCVDCP